MHSIMIDLETIATGPDAVVLTAGAVKFDPYTTEDPHSEWYCRLEIDGQIAKGRIQNEDTLVWWSKQSAEAQEEAFGDTGDRITVEQFLADLSRYTVGASQIWANGILFDIGILEHMCKMYNTPTPWRYSQIRDARTIYDLGDDSAKKNNTLAHNALADAFSQALAVQSIIRQLGVKRKTF